MGNEVSERREWLVRCATNRGEPAVCSIEVSRGVIEFFGPGDTFCFGLDGELIADFRASLDEAAKRVEADVALV
ncbi:hypothetical protein FHS29_000977 [Saccharothrix tamanrassetensis]|uniref:DUF397 domain-containing protein n=1 Tax=Saccharothrix tamanrassetensis TaxID=1051531 RepID=A0A841CE21_9PSEU|nr:hypothetical protein [Saccharothrix tamanrassetensis]MBB5954407.1 hypothetical protein [Saccharothrix tamanrassetensis]